MMIASVQTLAQLRGIHRRYGSTIALDGIDLSLHDYLADGLCNPLLRAAYEANRVRMAIFQRVRPFVQERIKSAMQEHLAIISALECRDADAAVAAIAHHCDRTRHWWGVPA